MGVVIRGDCPESIDRSESRAVRRRTKILQLAPTLELEDLPAVALGWSTHGCGREVSESFAFGGGFQACLAAGVGLFVEGLGDRCRPAYLAKLENLDLEFPALVGHSKHIPDVDLAGGLYRLIVGLDPSEIARASSQGARLEESGCPKPFVDADAAHGDMIKHSAISTQHSVVWASER